MKEKWIKPTPLNYISHNTKYVISIDESGSCSYAKRIHKILLENKCEEINEDRRYFTLCAVVFKREKYREACIEVEKLKNKYWKDGMYNFKDKGLQKVCFHTTEINKQSGCFSPDVINYNDFIIDLCAVLENIDCTIIAITLDLLRCVKEGHINDIYTIAFKAILQRFVYFSALESKTSIILESRGKKEDQQLLDEIRPTFFSDGLKNISVQELNSKIDGVYFNHKWRDEKHTYIGLEIADLFAYPIYRHEQTGKPRKDFDSLYKKIYGYPNKIKYGLMSYKEEK